MSYVSNMIVTCGRAEKPAIAALNAWCDHHGGYARFLPISLAGAGGTKAMQIEVYASGGNYFDGFALLDAFPTFGWLDPHEAVLIIYPEDGAPEIKRAGAAPTGWWR